MSEYTEAHAAFDRILTEREAEAPKTTPQLSLSLAIAYEMARESDMTVREARSMTVGVFEAIQRHGFKVVEETDPKPQNQYPGVTVRLTGSPDLYGTTTGPSPYPPGGITATEI